MESLNGYYIRRTPDADLLGEVERLLPHIAGGSDLAAKLTPQVRAKLLAAMAGLKERAKTLVELVEGARFIVADRPIALEEKAASLLTSEARMLLRDLVEDLDALDPWTAETTEQAIRAFSEPLYIGMTATEQLIAKQVSDVFPASVDDLPLGDAARRGLIAPLRSLRVPPAAAINSVPIVGGDFEERALAAALDHEALNQAAASLYRDRFGATPGIVYAAGVDHAYNLAQEFRAAGLKAEAVSGRTPPARLAETLAAYERGEINVLVNAQLLAEGWNSPRAMASNSFRSLSANRLKPRQVRPWLWTALPMRSRSRRPAVGSSSAARYSR